MKAQILLALDGVFLGFLSGFLFVDSNALQNMAANFGKDTWAFASGLVIALLASICAALICIGSRIDDPDDANGHLAEIVEDSSLQLRQNPETMWFFGHIAKLKHKGLFVQRMAHISRTDEVVAVSGQIFLHSKNVSKKHEWANRGFLMAGVALTLFLATAVSFVVRSTA